MDIIQTCLRWTYRIFWYTLVGLILAIAVFISIIRLFPPDVEEYRQQIEELASAIIESQVHIQSMDAKLAGFTPVIIFNDVHLLDVKGKREIVRFKSASLGIDFFRSIVNKKLIPKSFTIHGINLSIIRKRNGNLLIRGLDLAKLEEQLNTSKELTDPSSNELSQWLFERSELAIKDSTLVWVDRIQGRKTRTFQHVNFLIRNDEDRHQLTGTVQLPDELGRDFELAFDFKGNILNPEQWEGNFYAGGKGLQVANWGIKPALKNTSIEAGVLDIRLWGLWQKGRINQISTDITAHEVDVRFQKDRPPVYIGQTGGLFYWQRRDKGWVLKGEKFRYLDKKTDWPASDIIVMYDGNDDKRKSVKAYSSFIRLGDVTHMLQEARILDNDFHEILTGLKPSGDLKNFHFSYQANHTQKPDFYVSANFKDLDLQAWKQWPGFSSIDGRVLLNQERGEMQLDNSAAVVNIPKLFRQPFEVTRLEGKIDWWHDRDAWHVAAKNIYLDTTDIDSDLSLTFLVPDNKTSPYLDLQMRYRNGDGRHAWRYYPVAIMDKELVDWLDNGILDGHVTEGGFVFNGRFADFPFRNRSGSMLAHFTAKDVELNYQKGWPQLKEVIGDIKVSGLGLEIYGESGKVYNSIMNNTLVRIDSFHDPVLSIRGYFQGNTDDLAQYLVNSPIAPEGKSFYQQSSISGTASGKLRIRLPLAKRLEKKVPTHYEGNIKLASSRLSSWQDKLLVTDIMGNLLFDTSGMSSSKLTGKVYGEKTDFNLTSQNINNSQHIRLDMQGTLDIASISKQLDLKLAKKVSGKSNWQGVLSLGSKKIPGNFYFKTDLKGVDVGLPQPFTKASEEPLLLTAEVGFPEDDLLPVDIDYGKALKTRLLFNIENRKTGLIKKGTIQFMGKTTVTLPEEDQLAIRGVLLELPIDEWQDVLENNQGADEEPLLDALGVPVVLDLDYLHIVTRQDEKQYASTDPRKTTLINGQIADFRLDDMRLGKLNIKSTRDKDGIKIDELRIRSPVMNVSMEGSWRLRNDKQQTNLIINASTEDFGAMLKTLGYAAVIQKGSARAIMQANWFDTPYRFEMSKLNGTLGVVIDEGHIKNVQPGAGRMLGLLSVAELPRRLFLDFGELQEGFSFKKIYGQFEIEDGTATTRNLSVISPIAYIGITGRTGLVQQDFDQYVSVVPNVTGTLPAITWILGGGQVGAFTFILDQLFGSEVNKSAATRYHITGTWEKPVITKLKPEKQPESVQGETP